MAMTLEACRNLTVASDNDSLAEGGGEAEDEYLRQLAGQVEHYVMKRGIPIISAFGLVGNFLSLLVLTKEKLYKNLSKMEISAHIGLIALAVSDILLCLLVLLATTLPFKAAYQPGEVLIYFHLLSGGLITVFIITSTWLIVVMAAERYVAVCHALKARNLILLWRTRAYVIVLFLACPLCTVPVFLEKFIEQVSCADGSALYRVAKVSRDSVALRRIVWAMFFDFLPCGALIYFNTCLIWKIHKAKQMRERMAPLHSSLSRTYTASSQSRLCQDDRSTGDRQATNGSARSVKRSMVASLRLARGSRKPRQDHVHNLLEMSEGSSSSPLGDSGVGDCNGGVKGDSEARRGETQLLCRQEKNGMVRTSSCPGPSPSPPNRFAMSFKSRSLSAKRRSSDNALHSVTATLVAVVLTFLILVSPWELLKFAMQYSSPPMDRPKMDIALYLTNLMQVLNFSFNFVLYCLVNKSFRHTLRNIVCFQPISHQVR